MFKDYYLPGCALCSLVEVYWHFRRKFYLSCWLLAWITLWPWKMERVHSSKTSWISIELHCVKFQEIVTLTTVRTSNLTKFIFSFYLVISINIWTCWTKKIYLHDMHWNIDYVCEVVYGQKWYIHQFFNKYSHLYILQH